MKTKIEVKDRKEGELIRQGLEDPETRALVKIMGALQKLPNDWARARTLNFVNDMIDEGVVML